MMRIRNNYFKCQYVSETRIVSTVQIINEEFLGHSTLQTAATVSEQCIQYNGNKI